MSRGIIVAIAEATTNGGPRRRMVRGTRQRGGNGCVEKLADYSIVGPVVSVNRNAPWRFVVLLSRRSADRSPAASSRMHRKGEGAPCKFKVTPGGGRGILNFVATTNHHNTIYSKILIYRSPALISKHQTQGELDTLKSNTPLHPLNTITILSNSKLSTALNKNNDY